MTLLPSADMMAMLSLLMLELKLGMEKQSWLSMYETDRTTVGPNYILELLTLLYNSKRVTKTLISQSGLNSRYFTELPRSWVLVRGWYTLSKLSILLYSVMQHPLMSAKVENIYSFWSVPRK
jgi:hypothetical protein